MVPSTFDLRLRLDLPSVAVQQADIVRMLAEIRRLGLIPVERKTGEVVPTERWLDYLARIRFDADRPERTGHYVLAHAYTVNLQAAPYPTLFSRVSFDIFRPSWSMIDVITDVRLDDGDALIQVDRAGEVLKEVCLQLIQIAGPEFGALFQIDTDVISFNGVESRRLPALGWLTYFGPGYVATYGREFLLKIPGARAEVLSTGGVLHQVSPAIVGSDRREAWEIQRRVQAYFARAGMRVRCEAPYVLASGGPGRPDQARSGAEGASGPASPAQAAASREAEGTLDDYAAALQQLLETTLRLADGRRVKVLALDWGQLTAAQRQYTIRAIHQTAVRELAAHPAARIHFELNEVPPDLRAALDPLVKADGRLTYARVPMPGRP
jgi:hypothetical protein